MGISLHIPILRPIQPVDKKETEFLRTLNDRDPHSHTTPIPSGKLT